MKKPAKRWRASSPMCCLVYLRLRRCGEVEQPGAFRRGADDLPVLQLTVNVQRAGVADIQPDAVLAVFCTDDRYERDRVCVAVPALDRTVRPQLQFELAGVRKRRSAAIVPI